MLYKASVGVKEWSWGCCLLFSKVAAVIQLSTFLSLHSFPKNGTHRHSNWCSTARITEPHPHVFKDVLTSRDSSSPPHPQIQTLYFELTKSNPKTRCIAGKVKGNGPQMRKWRQLLKIGSYYKQATGLQFSSEWHLCEQHILVGVLPWNLERSWEFSSN